MTAYSSANQLPQAGTGTTSVAYAASTDGVTIVGAAKNAPSSHFLAAYWSNLGGPTLLASPGGATDVFAFAISGDGTVVAGQSDAAGSFSAVSWTGGGSPALLTGIAGTTSSSAQGVSSNGSVIVGYCVTASATRAVTWTGGGGGIALPAYGAVTVARAFAVSADGTIVVGYAGNGSSSVPLSWTNGGPAVALGFLSGGTAGQAVAISADGTTIAGYSNDASGHNTAVTWTNGGAPVALAKPGAYLHSFAFGVSSDGSVVAGELQDSFGNTTPVVWVSGTATVLDGGALGGAPMVNAIIGAGTTLVGRAGFGSPVTNRAAYWSLVPPTAQPITIAEFWFGNTSSFIDLTQVSNRRLFISAAGGAQNLGADGSAPFSVAPPVFLSRQGSDPASEFPANRGRGGSFAVSGGALSNGGSNPPGTTVTTTTTTPGVSSPALLGDYRNGNLYAFNPKTLTDNGARRKWVRRWRALANTNTVAMKFNWLNLKMQTGINVPEGQEPNLMLRWSDDGGNTWSTERILPIGTSGQTAKVVKFNRLGGTRRFAGTDRIFELSSTDPFSVQIFDADVEVA